MVFINAKDYPRKNIFKFSNLDNGYLWGVYSNLNSLKGVKSGKKCLQLKLMCPIIDTEHMFFC